MSDQQEEEKPLTYRDQDGTVLHGIPDLNKSIQKHNNLLKKYYWWFVTFLLFVMIVVIWILWQIKRYKIISLIIDAVRC